MVNADTLVSACTATYATMHVTRVEEWCTKPSFRLSLQRRNCHGRLLLANQEARQILGHVRFRTKNIFGFFKLIEED